MELLRNFGRAKKGNSHVLIDNTQLSPTFAPVHFQLACLRRKMNPESTPGWRLPNVKFRVLIIGRANAGKTSILQRVCDTTESPQIYRVRVIGGTETRELVRAELTNWRYPWTHCQVRFISSLTPRFVMPILIKLSSDRVYTARRAQHLG